MVGMSSPAESASLLHCSMTCNMTTATWPLKAGLGNRRCCSSSLTIGTARQDAAMAQPYMLVHRRQLGDSSCGKDSLMGINIIDP